MSSTASEPFLSSGELEKRKVSMVRHFIFFGIWAVIFGVEFLYRNPLRDKSLELQKKLAPHVTDAGNFIFEIFS